MATDLIITATILVSLMARKTGWVVSLLSRAVSSGSD